MHTGVPLGWAQGVGDQILIGELTGSLRWRLDAVGGAYDSRAPGQRRTRPSPFLRGLCDQTVQRQGRVVSDKELGEREGAMATWRNQIVLPVGRMQDRVDAGVGGAR